MPPRRETSGQTQSEGVGCGRSSKPKNEPSVVRFRCIVCTKGFAKAKELLDHKKSYHSNESTLKKEAAASKLQSESVQDMHQVSDPHSVMLRSMKNPKQKQQRNEDPEKISRTDKEGDAPLSSKSTTSRPAPALVKIKFDFKTKGNSSADSAAASSTPDNDTDQESACNSKSTTDSVAATSASQSPSLSTSVTVTTNSKQCQVCKKIFSQTGSRVRHEKTHEDPTRHQCPNCFISFTPKCFTSHQKTCKKNEALDASFVTPCNNNSGRVSIKLKAKGNVKDNNAAKTGIKSSTDPNAQVNKTNDKVTAQVKAPARTEAFAIASPRKNKVSKTIGKAPVSLTEDSNVNDTVIILKDDEIERKRKIRTRVKNDSGEQNRLEVEALTSSSCSKRALAKSNVSKDANVNQTENKNENKSTSESVVLRSPGGNLVPVPLLKCTFCVQRFVALEDRRMHEKSHTQQDLYRCGLCHANFVSFIGLVSHLKRRHEGCYSNSNSSNRNNLESQVVLS